MSFKRRSVLLNSIISISIVVLTLLLSQTLVMAETGSSLWLRFVLCSDPTKLAEYRNAATEIVVQDSNPSATLTPTLDIMRNELNTGLDGILGQDVPTSNSVTRDGSVVVGTPTSSSIINALNLTDKLNAVGDEGYIIEPATVSGHPVTIIASKGQFGALYGAYAYLRLMQTQKSVTNLSISEKPKVKLRQIDHWETERNYAGGNFIEWGTLPNTIHPRYTMFARACASVGINAFVFNNVNTSTTYLGASYILKEKALADLFRPYGIKVFLVAPYNSPINAATPDLGGVPVVPKQTTADPTVASVADWWNAEVDAIYSQIPDFGGFLVKAGSEGQSGPGDYGKTHSQGANLLGKAVARRGGIVLWRSFVYDATVDPDRLARCYKDFHPLDGQFEPNVFVQSKFGPLDFMPRETFNPLFGGLPHTNQAIELQITQEYTGQRIKMCYLPIIWQEILDSDTYANGAGTTVGKIIDGTAYGNTLTAMVGVANIGDAVNMTGQDMGQANFYGFGRMAWNWNLTPEELAYDWAKMTWSNDSTVVETVVDMLMGSRESTVDHQEPLGLTHQQSQTTQGDHYTPGPSESGSPPEWYGSYYNKADAVGLGYDRSITGSNMVGQYFEPLVSKWGNIDTCPENLLAWFHHVPWTFTMDSGRTFWDELCNRYQIGVHYVTNMRAQWDSLQPYIDPERFAAVKALLATHEKDAAVWRDTCTTYFATHSKMPIPADPMQLKNLTLGGVQINGFSPSVYNYTVKIPYGSGVPVVAAIANDPELEMTITQASGIPGQAVIKIFSSTFYGNLLSVYTIDFTYDCTLSSLMVDGVQLADFSPTKLAYTVRKKANSGTIPNVSVTLSDPGVSRTIVQAPAIPGQAIVTVTAGSIQTVYTVDFVVTDGFFVETGGKVSFEAETAVANSVDAFYKEKSLHTWTPVVAATSGDALQCAPDNGSQWTSTTIANLNLNNPELGYTIKFTTAGSYKVWVLVKAPDASGDSFFVGLDSVYKIQKNGGFTVGSYLWVNAGTISNITAGIHTLNLWVREDGLMFDKIYLTTGSETPIGTGPEVSERSIPKAPVFDAINNQSVKEGEPLQFTVNATDPDGSSLIYSASDLPVGASFDPATKTFSWYPGFNQSGTYSVKFFASNGGLAALRTITITVINNDAVAVDDKVSFISDDIPESMVAGNTYTVHVTVRNTGASAWTNIDDYKLGAVKDSDAFAANSQLLSDGETVASGQVKIFTFTMKAPTQPGTYTTDWQMLHGTKWFDTAALLKKTVTVTNGDNAAFVSTDIPNTMIAGQTYTVKITVRNTGKFAWTAANRYKLGAVGETDPFAASRIYLSATESINVNSTKVFTFTMKAPETAGTYVTDWRMLQERTTWFGPVLVSKTVTVEAAPEEPAAGSIKVSLIQATTLPEDEQGAKIVNTTIPSVMLAGQSYTVSVTVKNTGSQVWTAAQGFKLIPLADSALFTSVQTLDVNDTIAPGQEKTFTFVMSAPTTTGIYNADWQMGQDGISWLGLKQTMDIEVK